MDATLSSIAIAIARLEPLLEQGVTATTEPSLQPAFLATFDIAAEIYNGFKSTVNTAPLPSASEEQKATFLERTLRADSLYGKLAAVKASFSNSEPTSSLSRQASQTWFETGRSNVRLPKIALPLFDGKLKSWPPYYDLFTALIHRNQSLSDIERFQYLISSLSGEPLSMVKHLPLTGDNYIIAFDSLVERYQNDRVLVTFYWQSMMNASSVTSDSAQALRHLVNTFNENLVALEQYPHIDLWDFTLSSMLLQKLDESTRKRFEVQSAGTPFPKYEDVKSFVLDQCKAFEATALNSKTQSNSRSTRANTVTVKPEVSRKSWASHTLVSQTSSAPATSHESACSHCGARSHRVTACKTFLSMSPNDRYLAVKQKRLCLNCLSTNHGAPKCPSSYSCRQCHARHHTLLHFPKPHRTAGHESPSSLSNPVELPQIVSPGLPENVANSVTNLASSLKAAHVLLATAIVHVRDRWGGYQSLRALIDPASQASFILDSCVRKLGLSPSNHNVPVFGLGLTPANSTCGTVTCQVKADDESLPIPELELIVLRRICGNLPDTALNPDQFHLNLSNLADPTWFKPGPIQVLLGADVYPSVVKEGIVSSGPSQPVAINTIFGWALLGPFQTPSKPLHSFLVCTPTGIDESLHKFWEVEEISSPSSKTRLSPDDERAEICFRDSVYRCPSGRFGVSLPFKRESPTFEHCRSMADRRWLAIERRLVRQDTLRDLYIAFMRDYLDLGHMTLLDAEPPDSEAYYIPHHPIVKIEDDKPKIRVVFDASAQAPNHLSLNETLLVGPKLQQDIAALLLQFRCEPIVFTCDIRQMYRQILISPEHRKYQLIRFRFSPDRPIETYQLNTITYGVSSAPFLAVRTLLHLAEQSASKFPLASQAIRRNLYVDDLLCGANSVESARELQTQLINLLQSGCFELRKWASNHPDVLQDIPLDHVRTQPSTFSDVADNTVKILGLQWQAATDTFSFTVHPNELPCTKRSILSEVARIYDPLGFLCPVAFFAKHLIQRLWKLGLDWDDTPPDIVCQQWLRFQSELSQLSRLQIPRHTFPSPADRCQLHAFCDASESGYASVLYVRYLRNGVPTIRLLTAKSKVAPVKLLTVPRLELCAAVLLSNLVAFTVAALAGTVQFDAIFAWTDSTVVLSWLRSSSHRWKTFVAHRVEHIQQRVPPQCWRHVSTSDNPADPASRGLFPEDMLSCSLWWSGPPFLSSADDTWPDDKFSVSSPDIASEERKLALVVRVPQPPPIDIDDLFLRISSLRKIQGAVAYFYRFCKCKSDEKFTGPLSDTELHFALLYIVKHVQQKVFAVEIASLRNGKPCSRPFRKLSPFLDRDDVLRVGGRLKHCHELPFATRHPALLPSRHVLTGLVIRQVHSRHCHPGLNNTCYLLQQNFWILSTRRAVRHYLASCYRCFRTKPQTFSPTMGDLPSARISQLKPFSCVGLDYGGPFPILMSRARGVRTTKAYICLFVCFATKALHVEVASDLSTDAFLAALRRFIARRGRCSTIYSDNGTNFVGAHRQLTTSMQLAAESEAITWRFIPPSSPHFGGLWESGIKAVKTHLSRVIGDQILTFEELTTLVTQVEALLNSRPLSELSSDPNDLCPLTPGHFLTLEPLTAPPDPDLSHLKISRLSRWQLVQSMQQRFWARWRDEYLHTLYQRGKWHKSRHLESADVGSLVLIKDENAPPLKWRLGRISKLFPGKDGICRVADVRTQRDVLRRPMVKLCPLPSGQ